MRILLINNFFYMRGGDCKYTFDLADLLERKGHEVAFFSMQHSRNFPSPYEKYFISNVDYSSLNKRRGIDSIRTVLSTSFWNRESQHKLAELLKVFKPDVAHIQNILHHITPSILPVLAKNKIPIIAHLHDYNLICPDIYLVRDGKICEKCFNGNYFYGFLHACKKKSMPASFLAASQRYFHDLLNVYNSVSHFICPTQFTQKIFRRANFRYMDKLIYLPHIVQTNNSYLSISDSEKKTIVYAGRLIRQKGVWTLIRAAQLIPDIPIRIYGDGELLHELVDFCEENKIENVKFMGWVTQEVMQGVFLKAAALVFPSEWYEITGLSILEAAAAGTPAIVSDNSAMAEVVINDKTGKVFKMGDPVSLANCIRFIINDASAARQMGLLAREQLLGVHDPETHYLKLMHIYQKSILTIQQ